MKYPKSISAVALLLLMLAAYQVAFPNKTIKVNRLANVNVQASTLSITKVKKPWYAWRGLVVGKMEESIPEYQAIKGLLQKFYSFTEDHRLFGGIYLWQSEQDAQNWFNQAWHDRIEKKYGEKGQVLYFKVEAHQSMAGKDLSEGAYWAVLSHGVDESFAMAPTQAGLVEALRLRNDQQQLCYLSLWQDKAAAEQYFKDKKFDNEYFDTPILLNNHQSLHE